MKGSWVESEVAGFSYFHSKFSPCEAHNLNLPAPFNPTLPKNLQNYTQPLKQISILQLTVNSFIWAFSLVYKGWVEGEGLPFS